MERCKIEISTKFVKTLKRKTYRAGARSRCETVRGRWVLNPTDGSPLIEGLWHFVASTRTTVDMWVRACCARVWHPGESRNEKPYAGPYATVALQGADGPANGHILYWFCMTHHHHIICAVAARRRLILAGRSCDVRAAWYRLGEAIMHINKYINTLYVNTSISCFYASANKRLANQHFVLWNLESSRICLLNCMYSAIPYI